VIPTDADVALYREHGWWISPRDFIPDELLDGAARGQERLYAGELDTPIPGREGEGWQPGHGDDVLRKNDYASLMVDELGALVRFPAIGAAAARLAGADEIRLWHDQLLHKPPEDDHAAAVVGWHTDRQYWLTCSSTEMLTAWVPFHDCDEETGTLEFVDGSHEWSERATGLDFFSSDLAAQEAGLGRELRKVPAVLRRGQVSFHNCRTIHGSGPNRSGAPRRSLAIHLQPGDNHYVETGAHHSLDDLTGRNYADRRFCPRLFP
jgi:ectoine hydroxylase-related dioxygenase (phytanoyl-CoA dioxygenase family)